MASSASSDEGEIRDRDSSVEKATTSLPHFDGTSVDPQDRNRSSKSTSMSPEHGFNPRDRRSLEGSKSPYSDRPPRGSKRFRDDDYSDRPRDPRRFRVHYEDNTASEYKRHPRASYEDLDRGSTATSDLRYDDHDRYPEKRHRTRSRSPYRRRRGQEEYGHGGQPRRDADRFNGYRSRGSHGSNSYRDINNREFVDQSVSKRGQSPLPAVNARHEAKTTKGNARQYTDQSSNNIDLGK